CSRVFAGDIYGDHAVSSAGIIGEGGDKPLRPTDMLLYLWDGGLDVCVDVTGFSPLMQTAMVDSVPGRAVIDVVQHKRGKYMDRCAAIGYGFLLFSFSTLGELEADAITLLKRIRNAPLTLLVKPGGGIRPIVVGLVWRRLVSKVSVVMIGHSLDGYLDDIKFGVGASGGSEDILHAVNRMIEDHGDDVGLSMLLVDFKNTFNLVDREVMLHEVRLCCPDISRWVEFCYSNPARLYYGEHNLQSCQEVQQGDPLSPLLLSLVLHLLIRKIRDSFSLSIHAWYLDDGTIIGDTLVVGKKQLMGVFPPNIARPLHGVKLLGEPASVDFDFSSDLVMKRVNRTIVLMDTVARVNDPQCELLLLHAGISKLYFAMRTCSLRVFEVAQHSFDAALRSALERIVTAYGLGFGDWQWRLSTLPFGIGVYYAGDVLNYAFLASRLQSPSLQTKLLQHSHYYKKTP
ncbi:putative reverse transcriptase domain-containing protein, partial [Tanacetum coccineum]